MPVFPVFGRKGVRMAKVRDMTQGRPAKLILSFALPLMFGNMFQQMYTMVDTMVVGKFVGVDALASLGLQAEASGRNDILVEGRKVSGTAQRVYKTRILHHGTLLFDSDPDMVAGALNVDPEKFRSKGRKSVRSRIGNIRSFLKQDMTLQDFWAHLRVSLGKTDVAPEQLTAEELAQVQRLKEEKYDTWEWTYGRSPRYNYTGKRRWPGGNLEVYAEIHGGKAEQIRFYGDFMAAASMDAVTAALTGCQFRPEAFGKVLDGFDLPVYFGGITKDEILQTIFDTQA